MAAAVLVLAGALPAQTSFFTGISHYTLKNGLTVILHEQTGPSRRLRGRRVQRRVDPRGCPARPASPTCSKS